MTHDVSELLSARAQYLLHGGGKMLPDHLKRNENEIAVKGSIVECGTDPPVLMLGSRT